MNVASLLEAEIHRWIERNQEETDQLVSSIITIFPATSRCNMIQLSLVVGILLVELKVILRVTPYDSQCKQCAVCVTYAFSNRAAPT